MSIARSTTLLRGEMRNPPVAPRPPARQPASGSYLTGALAVPRWLPALCLLALGADPQVAVRDVLVGGRLPWQPERALGHPPELYLVGPAADPGAGAGQAARLQVTAHRRVRPREQTGRADDAVGQVTRLLADPGGQDLRQGAVGSGQPAAGRRDAAHGPAVDHDLADVTGQVLAQRRVAGHLVLPREGGHRLRRDGPSSDRAAAGAGGHADPLGYLADRAVKVAGQPRPGRDQAGQAAAGGGIALVE